MMIVHGKSCHFFKRMDNSLFMGVLAARFGTSLGSFVNSLITTPLINMPNSESFSLYIGFSTTIGLALMFALIGFVAIEIYTRIVVKLIRDMTLTDFLGLIHSNQPLNIHKSKKAIMNYMETKAQIYIQTFKLKNTLHQLTMFFRFANKSTYEIYSGVQGDDGLDIYLSDKDLSLIYLKTLYNRKSREIDLLYNLSTLMAYDHFGDDECHTPKALQVMNRVCKKSSFWNHLDYHYRAKEIQQYATDTGTADASQENDAKMLLLKENQDKLLCLHRDFWKEMINEPVKLSSVQKICEKISDISEECEETFMEALSDRKNKAYLRMYATYVELFHFDKDLAQAIHMEANQLDQEMKVTQSINKIKKKQVVPSASRSSLKSLFRSRTRIRESMTDQMSDAGSDVSNQIPNGFTEHFDQFDDSASVAGDNNAPEAAEQKKDYLFRNALKARRPEGVNQELIYGDVTKPDDDPVIGLYPSLDKLLKQGVDNCTLYLEQHNLTLTLKTKIQYCTGIDKVMTDFLTTITQTSENTRDFYTKQNAVFAANGTILDPTEIFMEHYKLNVMSHPLNDKLLIFMNEFVRVSSELSLILLLIFTCLGFLLTAVIGRLILAMIKNKSNQLYHTRMLMNYIPVEMLDRNEKLKNVALFNSFPNALVEKLNRKGKEGSSESGFNGVANIINSSVDGSALLNESGDIEIFNPAAHRMFNSTSVDVLGTKLCSLFEESIQETIRKTFESIIEQSKKSYNSGGNGLAQETLEAECMRRNQTKFPAKISLFTTHLSDRGTIVVCTIKDVTSEKKQQALLADEKKHSDNLLKNILPENVASRLKKGETFIAEKLSDITCFFSDMVGFTKISSTMQATELVKMLNAVVNGFDNLTELYDLEKIKTIGDAYFCVGGLHGSSDHPERMLKFAMSTFQVINDFNSGKFGVILENDNQLDIRIGINTGSALAGVIGTKKFAYDLWGDTINTASRMESTGQPGRVQISRSTYERVYDMGLEFEEKRVEVKGKGIMQSYLLSARHHISTKVDLIIPIEQKTLQDYEIDNEPLEQLKLDNNTSSSQNSME
ncbi:predicted protein [Naegleria gruberi]|uniref:Predicted protein n=1 Tax=Naegleria gruberi TaxID=5762 RepID=D2VS06_NAEGR|nr:uncharacterized protein NAEGRDRAFT_59061 [Naegleria gruberi]EFC40264.1 predicted protein [Naegleria gruberi]|eukprot:XP_002673008.1 predicted protein [Naegleria gruberi strain NEG-M]